MFSGRKTWVAVTAALAISSLLVSVRLATDMACASTCTAACQAAFAQCYKASGSNRRACEAQLQQCLAGCIGRR